MGRRTSGKVEAFKRPKFEKQTHEFSFERKVRTKFTHLLKFVSTSFVSGILRFKTMICNNVYKVNKRNTVYFTAFSVSKCNRNK